jgi:autotransporter-associated beta strand protein
MPAAVVLVVTLKVSRARELPIRLFAPCGLNRKRAAVAAARSLAAALAIVLPAGEAAWAACTPVAANNVTATCTGATSGGSAGYGTGVETGVTVKLESGATVTGNAYGIHLGDATVTNKAGASITASQYGIDAQTGFANVTNSGTIISRAGYGIYAGTNATVINNAGADIGSSITGAGIYVPHGFADVTNAGRITGGTFGTGIVAQSTTVINNAGGNIGGGNYGIETLGGGSSVFNAGTIGGFIAAIQFGGAGNTLTLAQGSVMMGDVIGTGSDIFQLGGTGAATFDVSALGPHYQGFGTFNKIDSSVWTLTGTSTYAGPVNVNGGTLVVNGDIKSSSGVTVNAGGTLGGNGIVGDTTINAGGTLAPGSSIGLLTVHGSLVFAAMSSYMVEVSPDNADRTNVTGTANLGGATVNAHFAAGSYVARQYTILNATGGLGDSTFNAIANTDLPANFHTTLSYDDNNAYLNLFLNFAVPSGLTGNQQNVGNALTNFFNTTGGIPLAFGALSPQGLTQVSGEAATGTQQTTFDAMTQFMGVLTDPFVARRGEGGSATGYADEQALSYAQKPKPNDALAAIYTKAPPRAPSFAQRWSVWAAGYGGSQTTDGNAGVGSNTATSRIFGTAVGADYRFSPDTLAGFALAGGGTNFSVANGGSGRSDLFQAGAFLRHTVGPAYISAALAYGWQDVTTDRTVTVAGADQLRAKFNANAFSGRVEGGYRFVTPVLGITPYAAGQFTTFDLPAYAEQALSGANTFALNYASKSVTASRSELGVRTDRSWAMTDAILTLHGRVAWAHDFNPDRNIAATFQTLPGASFVVDGAAQAHDAALTTASAEIKWLNGFSLAATFEGEFSDVTESYAGKGVVHYAW